MDPFHIYTSEGVLCVKFLAKFLNSNFGTFLEFVTLTVLFWLGFWCESQVWVIMGRGVLVFKLISRIDILSISSEIAFKWMPQHLTDDYSTLVQVIDWCRKATSHHLNQCRPRSMTPKGITRPQWASHISHLPELPFSNSNSKYRKISNITRTLVRNIIRDHYIFIFDFTPGINWLGKDNCKMRRETFKLWDLVWLRLEIWQYVMSVYLMHKYLHRCQLWAISQYPPHWGTVPYNFPAFCYTTYGRTSYWFCDFLTCNIDTFCTHVTLDTC